MVVLRSLILTGALFFACWFTLPFPTDAGGHHGGGHGLETLITAGVLASVLQKKKCGHGHGRTAGRSSGCPHEQPAPNARAVHYIHHPVMHHAPPAPPPMMQYVPQQPAPFTQAVHYMPAHMMPQPVIRYTQQAQQAQQESYAQTLQHFQPTDKVEVIAL